LNVSINTFVTFLKVVIPTKLTNNNCSNVSSKKMKKKIISHVYLTLFFWCFIDFYLCWIFLLFLQLLFLVKIIGSSRLKFSLQHLHCKFNFKVAKKKTVFGSLLVSCATVFSGQGISLLYDTQNNTDIYH